MGLLDDAIREHLDLKRRRGADPADVERAEREALGPVRRAPTSQNLEDADQPPAEAGFAYDHEDELGWGGDPRDAPERASGTTNRGPKRGRDLEADSEGESFVEAEDRPEPQQRPSRLARIFGRADPEPEPEPHEPEADEPVVMSRPDPDSRSVDLERPSRPSERTGDAGDLSPLAHPDDPLGPLQEPDADRAAPPPHPAGGVGDETTEYEVEPTRHPTKEPAEGDEDVLEETPEFLQDTPDHDRLWFEQRPPKDFDFDG